MNKRKISILYVIVIAIILSGCPSPEIILSGENTLTEITVNDGTKDLVGSIADSNITFSDSAVVGTTQVTVKAIQFSDKASANVNINDMIPLNKVITITAENNSTKNYAMSINVSVATMTGGGMTMTGSPVVPVVIGTITGARLAIAGITTSGAILSGSFVKVNNPILTELGILVTANETLNLELTSANDAPTGAIKLSAPADQLALVNIPALTAIPLSFTVPNLASFTTYYFRGYAAISGGGIVYTDVINAMTLASTVSVSNFTVSLPYSVAGMNSDGYFRMNYAKDPSPILSFGVLITSGNGITLALNGENAPADAILIRGNATAITAANASANGMLSLSASNLALETMYSFRGYVRNAVGTTYTDVSRQTTPITVTPIPDDNFRNAILSCINTNGATTLDGQTRSNFRCIESFEGTITANGNRIRNDALLAITEFNYSDYIDKPDNLKIRNLNGIEQMVNLTHLNVQDNLLTGSGLNLSSNSALTNLNIRDNSLSSLSVTANTALTLLNVGDNLLSSLNVSKNTALTQLTADDNLLSILNVAVNTALASLNVGDNLLSSLDLSGNTALRVLNAEDNSLMSLNVSQNTALNSLYIENNLLSSLDVSASTALTQLWITNNSLMSLDVSQNTALTQLWITNNTSLTCIRANASQLAGGITRNARENDGIRKDATQTLSGSCM